MYRFGSLLLSALAALALGSGGLQAQGGACDSICFFPEEAPPECECRALFQGGGWGAAPSDPVDPEAAALIDGMMERWVEAVADVRDYTLVQTSSVTPMPVVLHFEKEIIDGHPMFRMVDNAELANREQVARGEPTSQEIFGAMANLIGGGGGGAGEGDAAPSPALPSGVQEALGGLLGNLSRGVEETLRELSRVDRMHTRENLANELYGWWEFRNRAKRGLPPGGAPIALSFDPGCEWVWAGSDAFEEGDMPTSFGPGYEGYEVTFMAQCIVPSDLPVPLLSVTDIRSPDGQMVRLERRIGDFDITTAATGEIGFVPREEYLTMDGAAALIGNAMSNLMEVVNEVVEFIANEGAPTQEEMAWLLEQALAETGG